MSSFFSSPFLLNLISKSFFPLIFFKHFSLFLKTLLFHEGKRFIGPLQGFLRFPVTAGSPFLQHPPVVLIVQTAAFSLIHPLMLIVGQYISPCASLPVVLTKPPHDYGPVQTVVYITIPAFHRIPEHKLQVVHLQVGVFLDY